jgi:hypothetical protein
METDINTIPVMVSAKRAEEVAGCTFVYTKVSCHPKPGVEKKIIRNSIFYIFVLFSILINK